MAKGDTREGDEPVSGAARKRLNRAVFMRRARLNAAANVLEADDLQVAVKQVEVFVEHRKGRRARR